MLSVQSTLTHSPFHHLNPHKQMLSVQKSGVLFTTPDLRRLSQAWEAQSAEYRVRCHGRCLSYLWHLCTCLCVLCVCMPSLLSPCPPPLILPSHTYTRPQRLQDSIVAQAVEVALTYVRPMQV